VGIQQPDVGCHSRADEREVSPRNGVSILIPVVHAILKCPKSICAASGFHALTSMFDAGRKSQRRHRIRAALPGIREALGRSARLMLGRTSAARPRESSTRRNRLRRREHLSGYLARKFRSGATGEWGTVEPGKRCCSRIAASTTREEKRRHSLEEDGALCDVYSTTRSVPPIAPKRPRTESRSTAGGLLRALMVAEIERCPRRSIVRCVLLWRSLPGQGVDEACGSRCTRGKVDRLSAEVLPIPSCSR